MARGSSRSRQRQRRSGRGPTETARPRPVPIRRLGVLPRINIKRVTGYGVEDFRRFHPERPRHLRRKDGQYVRFRVKVSRSPFHVTWHGVKAESPLGVIICVKRKVRRAVLFATGGNLMPLRRPRRNMFSGVKCK